MKVYLKSGNIIKVSKEVAAELESIIKEGENNAFTQHYRGELDLFIRTDEIEAIK